MSQLEDDGQAQHGRTEHPGRPRQEEQELAGVHPAGDRNRVGFDLADAAMLELCAEREEHGADQRDGNPDGLPRIDCADDREREQVGSHSTTLSRSMPISLLNGRSTDSYFR
jgi:hypothetical protein